MQTTDVIKTQLRTTRGTAPSRRLRREGLIPVIVYGHGEANQALTLVADDFNRALRAGRHVLSLDIEGKTQNVLIKDLQYDPLGDHVLHADFVRISAHEKVEVTVEIHLTGQAPGVSSGGIMDQPLHEARVACPADQIPEMLKISISTLEIDQSLQVKNLELPEGVEILHDPEETIVVIHKLGLEEEEAVEAVEGEQVPSQPEIIGRKPEEESGEEKPE